MSYYKRYLPHWQPKGREYFVTFRLAGSLPTNVVNDLRHRRKEWLKKAEDQKPDPHTPGWQPGIQERIQLKIFKKYEAHLDKGKTGPIWLKQSRVADIVKESIHYRDQKVYDLYAYCIMSNHVHLVFKHLINSKKTKEEKFPITNILMNLKRYTARECNKILDRSGAFWQPESYDRVIRNRDELERIIDYTLNNPVKAGLTSYWKDWPHNYCKREFLPTFQNRL